MDISSYVTVLPIVIICYLVGIGCKASKKISDKTIPVIVGIVGGTAEDLSSGASTCDTTAERCIQSICG